MDERTDHGRIRLTPEMKALVRQVRDRRGFSSYAETVLYALRTTSQSLAVDRARKRNATIEQLLALENAVRQLSILVTELIETEHEKLELPVETLDFTIASMQKKIAALESK